VCAGGRRSSVDGAVFFFVTRSRLSHPPTTCYRLSRWGLAVGCSCISHINLMPQHIIHSRTPHAQPKDSLGSEEPHSNPADLRTGYPRNICLHCNRFIICLAQPLRKAKNVASFQKQTTVILSFVSVWDTRRQVLPTATLTCNTCRLNAN
jgi:hypothetical protein